MNFRNKKDCFILILLSVICSNIFESASAEKNTENISNPGLDFTDILDEIKLLPSLDDAVLARFGYSVSLSENRALVGAFGDGHAGSNTGSAYIFEHDGFKWNLSQRLIADDAASCARNIVSYVKAVRLIFRFQYVEFGFTFQVIF